MLACVLLAGCKKPIEVQLRAFGYTELQPPSLLVPPGTIVQVKQVDPLLISIVCTSENAFGLEIKDKIRSSPSSASVNSKDLEGSFSLDAAGIRGISGETTGKGIESVKITLTNVTIEELPDDAIFGALQSRKPICEQAITLRRARGDSLTLIKSAVAGDVTYTIHYRGELSASSRAELAKSIAASVGLAASSESDASVSGTHLYWGLRDDADLAALTPEKLPNTGGSSAKHLLTPEKSVTLELQ